MGDPISAYQEAIRERSEARDRMMGFVETVSSVSEQLYGYRNPGFLSRLTLRIDADSWPSADQMTDALAVWHQTNNAAIAAWDKIPENRRYGLSPPDHW